MAFYSKENNFLFIHIYKTGGMAVRKSLEAAMDKINKNDKLDISGGHANATDMIEILEKQNIDHEKLFKFSFVRHPYDWILSTYWYVKVLPAHGLYQQFKDKTFNEFLVWHRDFGLSRDNDKPLGYNKIQTQTNFLCDKEGKLLVNFVGKRENLLKDLELLCNQIGLPFIDPGITNSLINQRNPSWQHYYNREAKELVQLMLADDFNTFKYQK